MKENILQAYKDLAIGIGEQLAKGEEENESVNH